MTSPAHVVCGRSLPLSGRDSLTLHSFKLSAGMWSLRAHDLDQSIGRMLPKLPVMVHHILKQRHDGRGVSGR